MIYTITLNPTLDKTLSVPRGSGRGRCIVPGFIRQDIGGKGINVSHTLASPRHCQPAHRFSGRRDGHRDAATGSAAARLRGCV